MCKTAYDNLENGGKLAVCINATPLYPPVSDVTQKYGDPVKSPLPLHEGDPVEYSFFKDRCSFSLVNYHWSKGKCESAKILVHRNQMADTDRIAKRYGKIWCRILE
jgi:hypothetical protein